MGNFYSGISEKKVAKTGSYFKPGTYRVTILAVKEVKGQKNRNFFVIETKVLQSNNPEVPVGAERSQVIPFDNVMALVNIKQFIAAVSGVDATLDDVNERVEAYWANLHPKGEVLPFEEIVSQMVVGANALADVEMGLECVEIATTEGQPFTKHTWEVRQG